MPTLTACSWGTQPSSTLLRSESLSFFLSLSCIKDYGYKVAGSVTARRPLASLTLIGEPFLPSTQTSFGVADWAECRTRDRKVAGSIPGSSGGRVFFSRVHFLCRFIRRPFHLSVTALARKRPRSFCQKGRWRQLQSNVHTPLIQMKSCWVDYAVQA